MRGGNVHCSALINARAALLKARVALTNTSAVQTNTSAVLTNTSAVLANTSAVLANTSALLICLTACLNGCSVDPPDFSAGEADNDGVDASPQTFTGSIRPDAALDGGPPSVDDDQNDNDGGAPQVLPSEAGAADASTDAGPDASTNGDAEGADPGDAYPDGGPDSAAPPAADPPDASAPTDDEATASPDAAPGCPDICETGFTCDSSSSSQCEPICGDGLIVTGETCDDQNEVDGDGCSNCNTETGWSCAGSPSDCAEVCGNGLQDDGEACDDDNTDSGDGCSPSCAIETGWTCFGEPSICATDCGDGIAIEPEVCDDGNNESGDGCSATCTTEPGFTCSAIPSTSPSICTLDCGNGGLDEGEECDDENNDSGDGCSAVCSLEEGWECAGVPNQCNEVCGDGLVVGSESCDAALNADPGCSITCEVTPGYECSSIPSTCQTVCGDGVITPDEACDDNNTSSGDGCSACIVELGWSCDAASPSGCSEVLCEEDERVVGNLCQACPEGSTNAAGDGASGDDTLCDDACTSTLGVHCAEFEEAYVKASNTESWDLFGRAVSLSGDTLAVGASYEDSAATAPGGAEDDNEASDSGAVYVFVRSGNSWSQQAYLKASNAEAFDLFGTSVSLSGDTLAVGATGESSDGVDDDPDNNDAPRSGAVYVFTRSGQSWTQQAYLKASNAGSDDDFGESLSLSGDLLAVGARGEDSAATGVNSFQSNNDAFSSGAVYVFARTGTTWAQQAYIKASNSELGDQFGESLSLSGTTLAVGAPFEDSAATGVDADEDDNNATDSGAVYLFTQQNNSWSQQAYVKASNAEGSDRFGWSVSLSDDTLAVGADWESSSATGVGGNQDDNSATDSGAVYVFTRVSSEWSQEAYIKASNTGYGDNFGGAVAISGDTLAVAARFEESAAIGLDGEQDNSDASSAGAVYLFTRTGSTWSQQAYVKASNTESGDSFGDSLSLSGSTLAIGASGEDSADTGLGGDQSDNEATQSGAVYIRRIAP